MLNTEFDNTALLAVLELVITCLKDVIIYKREVVTRWGGCNILAKQSRNDMQVSNFGDLYQL